jgi:hypothetical protein
MMNRKTCSKCDESKMICEFNKNKWMKDGLAHYCRKCSRERYAKYYVENREFLATKHKEYYENNKEYLLGLQKKRREHPDNKDSDKVAHAKYRKNRYNNDQLYRTINRIGTLIRHSLRTNGYSKKSRTHEILGCSYEEFKSHIENQFTEGMAWDNINEWHLDHKVPVSWGKTEEEIIALNHYTNFQPLWAEENLKKNNKFAHD